MIIQCGTSTPPLYQKYASLREIHEVTGDNCKVLGISSATFLEFPPDGVCSHRTAILLAVTFLVLHIWGSFFSTALLCTSRKCLVIRPEEVNSSRHVGRQREKRRNFSPENEV